MTEQKTNTWKTIAIIFMVIFLVENIIIGYGLVSLNVDYQKDQQCQEWCEIREGCEVGYYDFDIEGCAYISQETIDYLNS